MNLYYPIRLWLLTISIGPILVIGSNFSVSGVQWVLDEFIVAALFFIVGAIASMPTLAVCYMVYSAMAIRSYKEQHLRIAACLSSVIGVWLTFILLFGIKSFKWSRDQTGLEYSGIYSTSIIMSAIILYCFRKRREALNKKCLR